MTVTDALVLGVTGGTFALLARPRIGSVPFSRAITSAAGAVIVVALGVLSPAAALDSLDATTLLLIFGMLCHVEALRRSGGYEWLATELADRAPTGRWLTLGALGLSALLSALALNDATVLLLTPVFVTATRRADLDPVLPLLGVVIGATAGSLATPLGNPQNAFILSQSGLTTVSFVATLFPVTLAVLAVSAVILALFADPTDIEVDVEPPAVDTRWALISAGFVLSTLVALLAFPGVDPGALAAAIGIAHLAWLQVFRRVPGTDVLHDVDWGILVMFAGIFVIVGALERIGASSVLGTITNTATLPGTTFVLSNLVSNVPAVILLSTTVTTTHGWFALAAASTLAGVATPIGSAATLIVLDQAEREGVDISLVRLLRVGIPVSILSTLVALGVLRVV